MWPERGVVSVRGRGVLLRWEENEVWGTRRKKTDRRKVSGLASDAGEVDVLGCSAFERGWLLGSLEAILCLWVLMPRTCCNVS